MGLRWNNCTLQGVFGDCLGVVRGANSPKTTPWVWGRCPRAAPGVPQPIPQTVLTIKMPPPAVGGRMLMINNTAWGVGEGTPRAALGHSPPTTGCLGVVRPPNNPQRTPKHPLQSVIIPPQFQQCLDGPVLHSTRRTPRSRRRVTRDTIHQTTRASLGY